MKLHTASGQITLRKRSRYAHWLQGWIDGGAFSGAQTLRDAWAVAQPLLRYGSAYAIGRAMAAQRKEARPC